MPSGRRGGSPHPRRRGKRVDTYGFYPLNSRFPLFVGLAKVGERRPLRKGERQSGYRCVCFATYSQFSENVLLHMRLTLRRRDITVSRNLFARCYGQFLRVTLINGLYRRVRRPRRTACNPSAPCITVGAANGRPHRILSSRNFPFSIFNSQFAESHPQISLECLLHPRENHSTGTTLHADYWTIFHKPNTAAAAPDSVCSILDTAA